MTTSNSPFSTAAIFVAAGAWQRVSKEFHHMKKAMICALLGSALACGGSALYAQTQDGSSQGQGAMSQGGMQHMQMSTDDRLQHMTQMLNLTSDQQQKIRPILDNESQQMQTLRSDTSMAREDKMTKMHSIRQNTMSQITPILTPDQQTKWESMQAHRRSPGENGASPSAVGPVGAPPTPPPPQQ
jgi:Spy/CpxP family protein refolding chaperone